MDFRILNELIAFRQNNIETTKKVEKFQSMSEGLLDEVNNELLKFENN